jgi:acylphosphatase
MSICKRCVISGRVQGVFFRASTREKALELGLTGRARNLPDGRVEVFVCGSPFRVEALCHWLQLGPPMARVDEIHCETVESRSFSGFEIR